MSAMPEPMESIVMTSQLEDARAALGECTWHLISGGVYAVYIALVSTVVVVLIVVYLIVKLHKATAVIKELSHRADQRIKDFKTHLEVQDELIHAWSFKTQCQFHVDTELRVLRDTHNDMDRLAAWGHMSKAKQAYNKFTTAKNAYDHTKQGFIVKFREEFADACLPHCLRRDLATYAVPPTLQAYMKEGDHDGADVPVDVRPKITPSAQPKRPASLNFVTSKTATGAVVSPAVGAATPTGNAPSPSTNLMDLKRWVKDSSERSWSSGARSVTARSVTLAFSLLSAPGSNTDTQATFIAVALDHVDAGEL